MSISPEQLPYSSSRYSRLKGGVGEGGLTDINAYGVGQPSTSKLDLTNPVLARAIGGKVGKWVCLDGSSGLAALGSPQAIALTDALPAFFFAILLSIGHLRFFAKPRLGFCRFLSERRPAQPLPSPWV